MKFFRILPVFVIAYLLSVFTTYFSMAEYKDTVSSSCQECSLMRDTFVFPLFSSIVLTCFFAVLKKIIKKRIFFSAVILLFFVAFSFFNNHYIFVDRISSWSSFTLYGELAGTISNSYLYLLISAVILYFLLLKLGDEKHDEELQLNESTETH